MRWFSLGLVALLISGCVASQAPKPVVLAPKTACENPRMDWATILKTNGIEDARPMAENLKLRFINAYNAVPPVSRYYADKVYLLITGATVNAFFVDGPCVVHVDRIPLEVVKSWMDARGA